MIRQYYHQAVAAARAWVATQPRRTGRTFVRYDTNQAVTIWELPTRTTLAAAERAGTAQPVVSFPHTGYDPDPHRCC